MVIGLYNESFYPILDGVVTTVNNYAYWLNRKHCRCFVVTPRSPKYRDDHAYQIARYQSIPVFGRYPYRVGLPAFDSRFRTWQKRQPMDLVHAHSPFFAGHEALRMARKRGIPLVATFHTKYYDDFLETTKNKILSKTLLDVVVRFFQSADVVWTVNQSTTQTLYEYGYRGDVEVMPNGVDDFGFQTTGGLPTPRFRETFGIKPDIPLLLYVGQLVWQKNIKTMLEAVALYKGKVNMSKTAGFPFQLALVGDGAARGDIRRMISALGLCDEVVLTGAISDRVLLSQAYRSADLFLFPSVYDTAALVAREAAFFGLPSILIEGANAAEDIVHGDNGFLCENTPEDLSDCIHMALRDDELRRKVGQRAKQTLPVSWEEIVEKAYGRYEEIVEEHKHRRDALKARSTRGETRSTRGAARGETRGEK
ncbi:MAG: glycosyltransferase [Oscillospiraceae bacterium]|nr:glycosyltransferase [Oscillospiraceae bacterium]